MKGYETFFWVWTFVFLVQFLTWQAKQAKPKPKPSPSHKGCFFLFLVFDSRVWRFCLTHHISSLTIKTSTT